MQGCLIIWSKFYFSDSEDKLSQCVIITMLRVPRQGFRIIGDITWKPLLSCQTPPAAVMVVA